MKKIYLASAAFFLITACHKKIETPVAESLPVIEAFLRPDQVPFVGINHEILTNTTDTLGQPFKNLTVTIRTPDGESRHMSYSSDGTYHPRRDWFPVAGVTYQLIIEYNGGALTAKTTLPPKPANVSVSTTTLAVATFKPAPGDPVPDPVKISWDNPDHAYFMLVVENADIQPASIFDIPQNQDLPQATFNSALLEANQFDLDYLKFGDYGNYRVILYRVNQEFVDFYNQNTQTVGTSASTYSNISGALGVFTSVNADTLLVSVTH
jgi:hypothetical protein